MHEPSLPTTEETVIQLHGIGCALEELGTHLETANLIAWFALISKHAGPRRDEGLQKYLTERATDIRERLGIPRLEDRND